MDVLKIAQRFDAVVGVIALVAAAICAGYGQSSWSIALLISGVVSLLSAKYAPVKWVLKRMLLARMK